MQDNPPNVSLKDDNSKTTKVKHYEKASVVLPHSLLDVGDLDSVYSRSIRGIAFLSTGIDSPTEEYHQLSYSNLYSARKGLDSVESFSTKADVAKPINSVIAKRDKKGLLGLSYRSRAADFERTT
jgi:hypothetical protein